MSTGEFHGKVVLVTGASRGIGRAITEGFARHGARVVAHCHRHRAETEHLASLLPGGPHLVVQADLANTDSAPELVADVVKETGRLDILVNNAGIYDHHPPDTMEFPEWKSTWDKTIAVNLVSPAYLAFAAGKHMKERGGGTIINISSRGAFRGEPHAPGYGAAKAGLNAMGQSLAKALAPYHVYVYTLAPGWVLTDMAQPYANGPEGDSVRAQSPLGRMAAPEEMARIVLFLASEQSSYMTGCIIDANGASYLRT